MQLVGRNIPLDYFAAHAGARGIRAAERAYRTWEALAFHANWNRPPDVQVAHPYASVLKRNRVVFNIKGNSYRLVTTIDYDAAIVDIRFFGTHAEYDAIDAETI